MKSRYSLLVAVLFVTGTAEHSSFPATERLSAKQQQHARPVIDGRQSPELMPTEDALAYFFSAVQRRQVADGDRRSRAYLAYLQIVPSLRGGSSTPEDEALAARIIDFATKLSADLRIVETSTRDAFAARDIARVRDLREARRERLGASLGELQLLVGRDASRRVETAVHLHVKRRMKLVR